MRTIILTFTLALLAACNMVEGAKEDAHQAGQAIQRTVEEVPE